MDNQNKLTKRQKYWLSSTWIKCEMPRCDTPFAELFTRQCTTSSSSRAITEMHCYGRWTAKGHYITQLSPLAATCQMAVFSCQFFCFPAYSFFRKKLELRQCFDLGTCRSLTSLGFFHFAVDVTVYVVRCRRLLTLSRVYKKQQDDEQY